MELPASFQVLLREFLEVGVAGSQCLDELCLDPAVQIREEFLHVDPRHPRQVLEQPVAKAADHRLGVGVDLVAFEPGPDLLAEEVSQRVADLLHLVLRRPGQRRCLLPAVGETCLVTLVKDHAETGRAGMVPARLEAAMVVAAR